MVYSTPRMDSALPLLDGEIPSSHAGRMAAYFRSESAREFCSDFDISFEGLCAGRQGELEKYSELIGVDVVDLSANAPIRQTGHNFSIGRCVLPTAYLARTSAWLCPECAAEDLAASPTTVPEAAIAIRRDNIIAAIGSCHRHSRPFVVAGHPYGRPALHDFAHYLFDINERLDQLMSQSPVGEAHSVDNYIRARIEGTPTNLPAIDPLSLPDALSIFGAFGNLLFSGDTINLRRVDRFTLNGIYQVGHELFERGEAGLCDLFETRLASDTEKAPGRVDSAKGMFGRALDVLYSVQSKPEFQQLLNLVAATAANSLRGLESDEFLGVKIERRWHRLSAVASSLRQPVSEVENLAASAGAITPAEFGLASTWVDLPKLKAALTASPRATRSSDRPWKFLSLGEAAKALGTSRRTVIELIESGLLSPDVEFVGASRKRRLFKPTSLGEWVSLLCGDVELTDEPPEGVIDLCQVKKHFPGPIAPLIKAISDRRIWAALRPNALPFNSILVRKSEAKEICRKLEETYQPLLTVQEFARHCGIGNVACHALVKNGFFVKSAEASRTYLYRSEAERFKMENITLAEIGRRLRIQPSQVKARMANLGLQPKKTGTSHLTLFDRSAFERIAA